jgi:hypothetical protein
MSTITSPPPRRSALGRAAAMRLARTEYTRLAEALADLRPTDWESPSDCPEWICAP